MAAASAQRTNGPCKVLAFTLLLIASLLNAGVTAEEADATTAPVVPKQTEAPEHQGQKEILPSMNGPEITAQTTAEPTTAKATEEAVDNNDSHPVAAENTPDNKELTVEAHTDIPITMESETPAPMPARGDGPRNIPQVPPVSQQPPVPQEPQVSQEPPVSQEPQPVPKDDVVCVSKEAVQDKNAVSLKLKASSSCKDTRVKIESVLQELCAEDCKLDIYQEDNTDEIIVSGKYVEDDVTGMTEKFNNDNIKDKTDVEKAVPRWGKNSKLVLVSLLLTGLLLAALLVAGYYLKTHRKNSKGVRLAESFQVDEENQANTLVSVAPLPQEPLDKPAANGESPPENGTNAAPTTNGHSATQTPVADTEM